MSEYEINPTKSDVARSRHPQGYVNDDGFQVIPGITRVSITVHVGPHTNWTDIRGDDMEAAMKVVWAEHEVTPTIPTNWNPYLRPQRIGALQFGIRNLSNISSRSEYSFSTEA